MCILYPKLLKLLGTDVCNISLLLFYARPLCYYLMIIFLCTVFIMLSQLHCSPPLSFIAHMILGFEHPPLELERKLCLFPHPFFMYPLSISPLWGKCCLQAVILYEPGEGERKVLHLWGNQVRERFSGGSEHHKCTVAGGEESL